MRPAPTSSANESAISTTTRAPRKVFWRLPAVPVRPASLSARARSPLVEASTGASAAASEVEIHPAREVDGDEGEQRRGAEVGEQDAESAAGRAEQEALRSQLAYDAAAAAADGCADGEFARAGRRANQEQITDIGAGDEKQERNGRKEREHRLAVFGGERIAEADGAGMPAIIAIRIFGVDFAEERFQFGGRAGDGNAGREPADGGAVVVRTILGGGVDPQRKPQPVTIGEIEATGHDADDAVTGIRGGDFLADDAGVAAKALAPELLAEDHDAGRVRLRIFAGEDAAEYRGDR